MLAVMIMGYAVPAREWFWQKSRTAALTKQVEEQQARLAELQAQEARWNDKLYVAAQIRTRLHYVLPGEVGYVVLDEKDAPAPIPSGDPGRQPEAPAWWKTLWGSVQKSAATPEAVPSGSATPTPVPSGSPTPSSGASATPTTVPSGSATPSATPTSGASRG